MTPKFPGVPVKKWKGYRIDKKGNLWSCRLNSGRCGNVYRKLAGGYDEDGYHIAILCVNNKRYTKKIHQLVLEAFVGPRPKGMQACHKNGKPYDNRLCNLKWGTPKLNQKHRRKHGTHNYGEKHGRSILKIKDILHIRKLPYFNGIDQKLSKQYKVTPSCIFNIRHYRTWKHLKGGAA